ncbi:MAG: nicotinamide mononucleotide transporter family protein [Verrucomicrobia bacterium]|nr:nicotinamide mononucleotide transporter family protein [Verrucomicrobiota bacterium]
MNSTAYIVTNLLAFVLGQWLVTKKHWSGFLVWCAANVYSIVTCVLTDMPQTSCLFGAYFLVNACSLYSWFAKSRPRAFVIGANRSLNLQHRIQGEVEHAS